MIAAFAAPAKAEDVGAYVRSLRAAAQAIRVTASAPASQVRVRNAALLQMHLPPAPLPGPPRFSPSLDDWLHAGLIAASAQKTPKQRASELSSLAATLERIAQVTRASAAVAQPLRDPRATARALLTNPAYVLVEGQPQTPRAKTLWQRFIDWLVEQFEAIFGGIFKAAAARPIIGDIIAATMLLLAAIGVSLVFYRLGRSAAARWRRRASEDVGEELARPADPDELYAAACRAAGRGQYARAVALLFQASLVALDRAGAVTYDPARTAGEYRRAVRRALAGAAGPFDGLARAFTLAAYAERPVSESDWSQSSGAYASLKPLLQAP